MSPADATQRAPCFWDDVVTDPVNNAICDAEDENTRVVVIELKRTRDGGHMELRALRCAASSTERLQSTGGSTKP